MTRLRVSFGSQHDPINLRTYLQRVRRTFSQAVCGSLSRCNGSGQALWVNGLQELRTYFKDCD